MPTALITGVTGQDGAYLARLLLEKGYKVVGGVRRNGHDSLGRLDYLGVAEEVETVPLELLEHTNLLDIVERIQPDEIYNLAAQSYVGVSFQQPLFTAEVTGLGALRLLEAVQQVNRKIKFYQASSSEMFGKVKSTPQNEDTPFHPRSPYAVAKAFAHWSAVNYREAYGMFVCCGILFNHESPLRGTEFVTRKITHSLARIKKGKQNTLHLGNLEAQRDWGYAPEYVQAMWAMLQQEQPDDYVVATGEAHSVREFAQEAFAALGLDWQDYVIVDEELRRPADVELLVGDSSKAQSKLGWKPSTRFKDLVGIMVEEDLKRV
jgi:GDPmannose 4,6-dehydratase